MPASPRFSKELHLRLPLILMVIAATAIPVELRPCAQWALSLDLSPSDVVANLIGYLPVGLVLAGLGRWRAALGGALLSALCEAGQLVMLQRSPSPIDLAMNTLGAGLGALGADALGLRLEALPLRRWMAAPAAAGCLVLALQVGALAGDRRDPLVDPRPGVLLAHWRGADGVGTPSAREGARDFDGVRDYVSLGAPAALQVTHSLTIGAWINPRTFPSDDAPIVSAAHGFGYQLDTTRDQGRRTVGFKLTDACGRLMARYGATTLATDTWYYVAGVYDADARSIHVYLNGELDDGVLAGTVTSRQRQSRRASEVYIGRRSGSDRFYFAGSIGEVRIYSRALTQAEIREAMRGAPAEGPAETHSPLASQPARGESLEAGCAGLSEDQDAQIPGLVAACGALLALLGLTLFPGLPSLACVLLGALSGAAMHTVGPHGLPAFNGWMLPLVGALSGGMIRYSLSDRDPGARTLA